jgi:hypothetical protein
MNALADHFDEQARRADAAESAITDQPAGTQEAGK